MNAFTWTDPGSGWTARLGAASACGDYRERNEDFIHVYPDFPLALVFDAFSHGPMLALRAVAAIREQVVAGRARGEAPVTFLDLAFHSAHAAVVALGALGEREPFWACGTTVVGAYLHNGQVFVPWVGDSMAYRVSGARIERLTWPHDFVNLMARREGISAEEYRRQAGYIKNVLIAYLGSWPDDHALDIPSFTPCPGDRLILATDGVWGLLTDDELLSVCQAHSDPQACALQLVLLALERGSRDNCTAVVIAFEWVGEGAQPEQEHPRRWWQFWR